MGAVLRNAGLGLSVGLAVIAAALLFFTSKFVPANPNGKPDFSLGPFEAGAGVEQQLGGFPAGTDKFVLFLSAGRETQASAAVEVVGQGRLLLSERFVVAGGRGLAARQFFPLGPGWQSPLTLRVTALGGGNLFLGATRGDAIPEGGMTIRGQAAWPDQHLALVRFDLRSGVDWFRAGARWDPASATAVLAAAVLTLLAARGGPAARRRSLTARLTLLGTWLVALAACYYELRGVVSIPIASPPPLAANRDLLLGMAFAAALALAVTLEWRDSIASAVSVLMRRDTWAAIWRRWLGRFEFWRTLGRLSPALLLIAAAALSLVAEDAAQKLAVAAFAVLPVVVLEVAVTALFERMRRRGRGTLEPLDALTNRQAVSGQPSKPPPRTTGS